MIREITIQNFKSIQNLEMNLGRVNVLIGANGAGKSNILEALALSAAAYFYKLDTEFLTARGIRVTDDPRFMRAAFDRASTDKDIGITLNGDDGTSFRCALYKDTSDPFGPWMDRGEELERFDASQLEMAAVSAPEVISSRHRTLPDSAWTRVQHTLPADLGDDQRSAVRNALYHELGKLEAMWKKVVGSAIPRFLVYAPEYSRLRVFEDEAQIQPVGIHGEGLFRLIKFMGQGPDAVKLSTIREKLSMFDWFDDLRVPQDLVPTERRLEIRDRYLAETLEYFDQKSSSEGFLFVLFYLCVLLSDDTPRFFAIDNVDTSLNPRLCTQLMIEIAGLTKDRGKQVILTTHNPAVLDGLDLNDDEQRLFVVSRNKNGQTRVRRVEKPKRPEGSTPVRLSEAFIRGYLGGLPNAF